MLKQINQVIRYTLLLQYAASTQKHCIHKTPSQIRSAWENDKEIPLQKWLFELFSLFKTTMPMQQQ
jgi:hypothetical protein